MKFTYNWLKQYVDFDWSAKELAEKLTFAGIEVEAVVKLGGDIPPDVVITEILSTEKHPNADRLSVCRVSGDRQIVCGAKNYKVGDKVPLALPGAKLSSGLVIQVSKLRGIESQGMLCSGAELGLSKDQEGLLLLPPDAPVGTKLADYLGPGDTVFDVEVTPNRPDWLSVIGIAREISALTGNSLKLPEIEIPEEGETTDRLTSVILDAPQLCGRYAARVIRDVKIGPSPAWLKRILEKVGMRSINNIVDVTNYVMLECGHPLHAFDYNLLAEHRIIVRRAQNGERFAAIDDSTHELDGEMLVIADAKRAVALGGIMGGKDSEINDKTADVLLESAWFLPANIRKTSKMLALASESSYRFERGADIGGVIWASNRATQLIQQLAGGQVARGIVDALSKPIEKRRVHCRYAQVNRLLGIEVPPATVKTIFAGLGLSLAKDEAASCEVEVPTFRVDLEREADLIEEVCRIYGVEKIPPRMQPATPAVSEFDAQWDARRRLRAKLTALGFDEAINQTLVAEGEVKLQNPLTADQRALRSSLVPGLLTNLRTNVSRYEYDAKLFEIGRVFAGNGNESMRLALAATGSRSSGDRERTEKVDYFDLKGALEELGLTAEVRQIGPSQAKALDLRDAVFVAECELPAAARVAEKQFRELPKYPAVVRDVAFVVDESVQHAEVIAAIQEARNKLLERVELFDIFEGAPIPSGKKSMAYSLRFRAADRTLTDAEVNEAHERIKRRLEAKLRCEIRQS